MFQTLIRQTGTLLNSNVKEKNSPSRVSTFVVLFLGCLNDVFSEVHAFLSPQICNLEEQLEQFREELENKSEEVQQLHMQLEIQRKEISSQQEYLETRDSLLQVNKHALTGTLHSILSLDCQNTQLPNV